MNKPNCFIVLAVLALIGCQNTANLEPKRLSESQIMRAADFLPLSLSGKVNNLDLEPNWLESKPGQFWYESDDKGQSFYLFDPARLKKHPLFDPLKLAKAIERPALDWSSRPLSNVSFDGEVLAFRFEERRYACAVKEYNCEVVAPEPAYPAYASEDKLHFIKVVDYNLHLCKVNLTNPDGEACKQLTRDGTESSPYAVTHPYPESMLNDSDFEEQAHLEVLWSNNSRYAVSFKLHREGVNRLTLTDSVSDNDFSVNATEYYYPQAGDAILPAAELVLIDVLAQKAIILDAPHIMQTYYGGPLWGYWHNNEFYYHDRRRGNRQYFLRKVIPEQYQVQTLIEETDEEFIDPWVQSFRLLNHSKRVIWTSQRTGYQHLYLYDGETGQLNNAITSGDYTVRAIRGVDEKRGLVYFEASGRETNRDPYLRHLYRVNLDGSELTLLTPEAFEHDTRVSPDFTVFVDTYSDHKTPPVTVLRSTETGEILEELQAADTRALFASGWQPPEAFSVTADDGETQLYGLLYFPSDFDPNKRYAIIDDTYTGPHNFFTPKSFQTYRNQRPALAELGFIVMKMDGRGTNKRGKAFHRHSYKNLAAGTDDHVWAIKQLAKHRSYLDIERVGIFGFSAGGYDTVQAMLRHPEFFKVGVSASGNTPSFLRWG